MCITDKIKEVKNKLKELTKPTDDDLEKVVYLALKTGKVHTSSDIFNEVKPIFENMGVTVYENILLPSLTILSIDETKYDDLWEVPLTQVNWPSIVDLLSGSGRPENKNL